MDNNTLFARIIEDLDYGIGILEELKSTYVPTEGKKAAPAEWVYRGGSWECSMCGHAPNEEDCCPDVNAKPAFLFCPYCGAPMQAGQEAAEGTVTEDQ